MPSFEEMRQAFQDLPREERVDLTERAENGGAQVELHPSNRMTRAEFNKASPDLTRSEHCNECRYEHDRADSEPACVLGSCDRAGPIDEDGDA